MSGVCPKGHKLIKSNIRMQTGPKGRRYTQCRTCYNYRCKMRYRWDEKHREKEKSRKLARYYQLKEANAAIVGGAVPQNMEFSRVV